MIFRKYFCNPGLLKKEFKRTKYIMFLHTILLLLCTTLPAVLLNEHALRTEVNNGTRIHEVGLALVGQNMFMIMAVMLASFGTAYFLLSYMFKKKSVIFYGSMPEKKSCIFTTKFIAAVLSVLVPIAAVCAVNLAVSAALSVNEYVFILKHFAFLFSQYVFLIAAFSFAAALSGNFLSMLGTAGFGFLIYPLVVLAISGNIAAWFQTYTIEYTNIDIYYAFPPAMICGYGINETKYIVFEIILGAALLALGIVFSTKRAAENSEKFFAFRFVNAVIKYCAAALIGLVIGCAFASDYTDSTVLSFILYIVFAVLTYIILQAIFEKSFKAMFSNLKHLAVFAVLFAALITVPIFDVFGLDFSVPENPKSVTFAVTNNVDCLSYTSWGYGQTFTNPDIINAVLTLADENKAAAKERNYDPSFEDDDGMYCISFSVKFDGSPLGMSRVFPYATRDMMDKCFGKFYDTEDYKRAICAAVDKLNYKDIYGDIGFDLQPECQYYAFGSFDKNFVDGFKKVLKADIQKYSYADISNSREFAYVNKFDEESVSLIVYDCYEDTVNYLLDNYFLVPATEMIELRNPANEKSVQITDINEMKSIFRVGRGYYDEIGENMCHIYAPSEIDLPDSGEKTEDFVIVADAYIDDLPEKIAAKLK